MTGPYLPKVGDPNACTLIIHLVSHASGELVEMVARNCVAQLENVAVERHLWKMVRSLGRVPEILAEIASRPGIVFHSIADTEIREALHTGCEQLALPCLFVLEPFVSQLSEYSGAPVFFRTAARDAINEDYYRRVEAMKFTLAHDDGVASDHLEDADVILLGVSRATKTPTCMYLASHGVKAANVPLVPGVPLPDGVLQAKGPLVVGLTISPRVLSDIRSARLARLSENETTFYSEVDSVAQEVQEARRLCVRHGWRVIDVTGKPIEQTANAILELLAQHLKKRGETLSLLPPEPGRPPG